MSGTSREQIYEEELNPAEQKAVQGLHDWLVANPDVQWTRTKFGDERCLHADVASITEPLRLKSPKQFFGIMVRISASMTIGNTCNILPVYPCEDCSIRDGQFSYAVKYGKKLRIPKIFREVTLHVEKGVPLHFFWIADSTDYLGAEK